jgi:tetratricopeptide (TPR) repeat protein
MSDPDFSAWEAPPPPDGLADAVIARMDGTAVGPAMPATDPPAHRRRWVIAASAAAALLAAGGLWAIVRHRERAPAASGEVVADRAQHLELGGASADLDGGADIRWQRTSHGLQIIQRAGTAVWRIAGEEHVVIGAASASIEAAGASLRVEVPMNMSDARVIGASTVTAATVALVTVVVYQGHVKVANSGQTVVVQPGTTYTVPAPQPTPPPEVVGVAPVTGSNAPALTVGCDADALRTEGENLLIANKHAEALVKLDAAYACKPDQRGAKLAFMAACNAINVTKASEYWLKLPDNQQNQMLQMCVRNGITREQLEPHACDADELVHKGIDKEGVGQHIAALSAFEEAIRCQPSTRSYQLAFMAACNARSVGNAAKYWNKLAAPQQQQLLQMCERNGIMRDMLESGRRRVIPAPTGLPAGEGKAHIDSVPAAKILVDGNAIGPTPLEVTLPPGKHKVTYAIGDDRFTYSIVIKAGELTTLSKDLR